MEPLDANGEEDLPFYQLSQQYGHEYAGTKRQKVFNDSVHGEFGGQAARRHRLNPPAAQRLIGC